jgi:hypothetical protein
MRRLLVLDDFVATWESVAHEIELVRRHTPAMPEVVIAAPLWVPVGHQNSMNDSVPVKAVRLMRRARRW